MAALGLWILAAGASDLTSHEQVVMALAVLAFAGLAAFGRLRGLAALPWLALLGAAGWWIALVVFALGDAADHATVRALWLEGHGLGLLAASALLLLPIRFAGPRTLVPQACGGAAATLLTVTVALPGTDEGATLLATVSLVLLLLWSGTTLAVPGRWRAVALAPLALSGAPVAVVSAGLLLEATANVLAVGEPFTRSAGVRLPDVTTLADPALLVPCVVGLLVAAAAVDPAHGRGALPAAAAFVGLAATATLALGPAPLWVVIAASTAVAAGLVADALRRADRTGSVEAAAGALVGAAAVTCALPSAVLTTLSRRRAGARRGRRRRAGTVSLGPVGSLVGAARRDGRADLVVRRGGRRRPGVPCGPGPARRRDDGDPASPGRGRVVGCRGRPASPPARPCRPPPTRPRRSRST